MPIENSFEKIPLDDFPKNEGVPTPNAAPESSLSIDFDEHGNLIDPLTALDQVIPKTPSHDLDRPHRDHAPPIFDYQKYIKQAPAAEKIDPIRHKFDRARKLGRDILAESRQREDRKLRPYLDRHSFNAGDVSSLQNLEQLSVEDVAEAERASLAITLQAADQIAMAKPMRPRAEQALQRRVLEDEIDSLHKVDSLLGTGFRRVQAMLQEGRATEVVQEARDIIARSNKDKPDQIKASDKKVLQWIEDTIHLAGKRVRKHRTLAEDLLNVRRR